MCEFMESVDQNNKSKNIDASEMEFLEYERRVREMMENTSDEELQAIFEADSSHGQVEENLRKAILSGKNIPRFDYIHGGPAKYVDNVRSGRA